MTILVTGASGLVGSELVYRLLLGGQEVRVLLRPKDKFPMLPADKIFHWNEQGEPDQAAFVGADAIVHLAGENIAGGRWTSARKKKIYNSRIESTQAIHHALARMAESQRPKIYIGASAVGFYGAQTTDLVTEKSPAGSDFLAEVCRDWEAAHYEALALGLRVVCARFAPILSRSGGFLAQFQPVVLGSGRQATSWVHLADAVEFLQMALREENISGSYNVVAPHCVTNREFTTQIAKALQYPVVLRAPEAAIELALGEMGTMILSSQKVSVQKILGTGFRFRYGNLAEAATELSQYGSYLNNFFTVRQFVPMPRAPLFQYFARAENLETLTPPWLHFHILKNSTAQVQKGSLIDYKLRVHGMPVHWRTLISEWNPDVSFIDEQLKGPYAKWHHVHKFESVSQGTLLSDQVTYQIPGSLAGKVLVGNWIQNDVRKIFSFRQQKIQDLYAKGGLHANI